MELICCFCSQSTTLVRPGKYLGRPVAWQCRCGHKNTVACLAAGRNRGENHAPTDLDKRTEAVTSVWRTAVEHAFLEVLSNELTPNVQRFELRLGINTIGRLDPHASERADWAIETADTCVSKRHLTIEKICRNGLFEYVLSDNRSKNQVFLNVETCKRIDERTGAATGKANCIGKDEQLYLQSGDHIGLGAKTTVVFRIAKSDNATPDPVLSGKRNTSN